MNINTMMKPSARRKLRFIEWAIEAVLLTVLVISILAIVSNDAAAQTLQFGASVTSGDGEVSTTLTWSAPDASACEASSTPATNFAGARDARGSEAVERILFGTVFRIACTWDGDRRATLRWTPPTQNTNGTPLTDLAGYTVHYGRSCDVLEQSALISDAVVTSYIIDDLEPATWCFAIRARNAAGRESDLSNAVTKLITADQRVTEAVEVQVFPIPARIDDLGVE